MKPPASLSLDLDNQWSYLKTHGDPGWEDYPSYLPLVVPRVLDFLEERGLAITFFVVGRDATRPENAAPLRALADSGHEIGNHSFEHEPWLHLYSAEQVEVELSKAEAAIQAATGQRPRGFRGPGFSLSPTVLEALARRGYLYDASTFPTFLGPLARAYYFHTARLSPEEKQQRALLFGRLSEGFRPLRPYRWATASGPLLEIPVTTMPLLKTPMHISYLLYLSTVSPAAATAYFQTALTLCRLTNTPPSLLLHPLDFLGGDDVRGLDYFPGMRLTGEQKVALVGRWVDALAARFTVVPLQQVAQAAA